MSHVLLVDDCEDFRAAVATALQRRGYGVTCAANGAQALGILEHQRPDLVILDLMMPEVDGLSVLRRMRLKPALADMPVIVLTGVMHEQQLLEVKALGAQSLIKHCLTLKELCQRVGERLERGVGSGCA
jgi:CheY-like chemotaxis protein